MPQVENGPKELNSLLEQVYDKCISAGGNETSCSKQAWGAAEKAGWKKEGDKWVKKKMDFAEMNGVEVIYSGTFEPMNLPAGQTVDLSEEDIEEIKVATEKYMESVKDEPYAKLDHGTGGKFLPALLKSASLGYIKRLYTESREKLGKMRKVLVADLHQVPQKFKELVISGILKKRSAEIRHRKGYGLVLDALAFFGVGQPAVKGLNDLSESLVMQAPEGRSLTGNDTVYILQDCIPENNISGENKMEISEIKFKEMQDTIASLNTKISDLENGAKFKELEAKSKAEVDKYKEERDKIKTEYTALIVLREQEAEAENVKFVKQLIADKKLEPSKEEETLALFAEFKGNAKSIAAFKGILEGKAVSKKFTESAPAGQHNLVNEEDKESVIEAARLLCKENDKDPDNQEDFIWAVEKLTAGGK